MIYTFFPQSSPVEPLWNLLKILVFKKGSTGRLLFPQIIHRVFHKYICVYQYVYQQLNNKAPLFHSHYYYY